VVRQGPGWTGLSPSEASLSRELVAMRLVEEKPMTGKRFGCSAMALGAASGGAPAREIAPTDSGRILTETDINPQR
jgi:hypothetical protein